MFLKQRIRKLENITNPKVSVVFGNSKEEIEQQMRKYAEEGLLSETVTVYLVEPHDKV